MTSRTLRPVVECLLAAALFGASTPAAKALLAPMGPLTLAGLLYLGAAAGSAFWALRERATVRRADRRNWLWLGGAILFGGGLGPALLMWGLVTAPAASAALWLNLESVATALLGWAFFREHLSGRTWLASALVCGASVLLASPSAFALAPAALLVLLACICWGLDNSFTALIDRFTPAQSTFAKGLVAGTVNLLLGLWLHGAVPEARAVGGALLVGLFSYGLSMVLYISGAQQLGATRAQMVFATAPFWGVLIAWAAMGEPLAAVQLAGGGLMAGALWLMQSEHHAHLHTHAATRHTHLHRHDDEHHTHAHPGLPAGRWHRHEHTHEPLTHGGPHRPDLHHRHEH
ncbi:MAG: EamA family transporter [Candidatus Lambdaproteobacteria bacterium]|nr:EamA family transporter [Candidatus Lambdaproteobacteria bacterium]